MVATGTGRVPLMAGVVDDPERGMAGGAGAGAAVELEAPAKLTVSLRVTGVRPDGYHLISAEMVTLDLTDTLAVGPGAHGRFRSSPTGPGTRPVGATSTSGAEDNLVIRALAAVGRTADVRLVKRIPPGAGLGGGSADAAAVLRWAGCTDPAVAADSGADVPFCLHGGRALVSGIGEEWSPLPFEDRSYVLVLPPFGVDTAAVYRAWDALDAGRPDGRYRRAPTNDLEAAAMRGGAPSGGVEGRPGGRHGPAGPPGR